MNPALYRSVWRWHFYAGLFVIPFVLLLSLTGAVYLFKPQTDRWEERAFRDVPAARAASPIAQVRAAQTAFPGARFDSYRLPERPGDATMIHLALADGGMRDVFVARDGRVLGSLDPDARISAVVARIHGNLLIGRVGDWLVELAASWAVVMIATGLYLWWPKDRRGGRGLAGVLWPRPRAGLRDLHAVTGFWVAGLALVLLLSGLPWAGTWGAAFKAVRTELGWIRSAPDWKIGAAGPHGQHDHRAMAEATPVEPALALLPGLVARAEAEALAFPVLVKPPNGSAAPHWVIKSEAQNRPLQRTLAFDAGTGREVSRSGFADKHPIDRVVGYGIAWHEGQLFGWVNQLIGLFTAGALITLAVTSFLIWRRRRPVGTLGAPPPVRAGAVRGVTAIVAGFGLLLPMLGLSLLALLLLEWLVLRRVPATAAWLGLRPAGA
jgi:uncharacterized iron-regulated membrane protein